MSEHYPALSDEEAADILGAIGLSVTPARADRLSELVEVAVRTFVYFVQSVDPDASQQWQREYDDELQRIATDPARALDAEPSTEGGHSAREHLGWLAIREDADLDTRSGAARIGDLAKMERESSKLPRVDAWIISGERQLMDDICTMLQELAPNALGALPSRTGEPCPATEFAMGVVQVAHDRARARITDRIALVDRRLRDLLNRSHRSLRDALAEERRFRREHGDWIDGEVRASIFGPQR